MPSLPAFNRIVLLAFILLVGMICIDKTSISETINTGNKNMATAQDLLSGKITANMSPSVLFTPGGTTAGISGGGGSFASIPSGGGDTSGGGDYYVPQRDTTYDQWGGRTNYDNLINNFNTQKDNSINSVYAAGDAFGTQYGRNITDWLENLGMGQRKIDAKAANNDLAKLQGVQGVQGMVGRGIRSSQTMLGNKNAGDSSAAGAIANAYGQQGRRQLANIGNQYEQGNQEIKLDQEGFDITANQGMRGLLGSKEDKINELTNSAQQQLAALDAQIAGQSLPNRIAIEQEKNTVKQNLIQKLQAFDNQLTQGRQGVQATTADQRREEAQRLAGLGTDLGAGAFDFTTEMPGQFQGVGPAGGALPLFTLGRNRKR